MESASQPMQALQEQRQWTESLIRAADFLHRHTPQALLNHPVGEWLARQHFRGERGRLSPTQRQQLADAGIDLAQLPLPAFLEAVPRPVSPEDECWLQQFDELDDWQARHGHCDIRRTTPGHTTLARWAGTQRTHYHQAKLELWKQSLLDSLGFRWEKKSPQPSLEALWNQRYTELAAYQQQHGHTNVTSRQNKVLGHWREVQREFRRKGKLSPERIARLDAIGFEWEAPGRQGLSRQQWEDARWKFHFEELKAFMARFGHTHVPVEWQENKPLGEWSSFQRSQRKEGRLPEWRRLQLDAIGFPWEPNYDDRRPPFSPQPAPSPVYIDLWEQRFAELAAFQRQHGHTNITRGQDRVLGHWRDVQREFRRKGILSPERIARLDSIGFEWRDPRWRQEGQSAKAWREQRWQINLEKLKAFHQRFGHCRVPAGWPEDRALSQWVSHMRKLERQQRLTPERITQLNTLSFDWHPTQGQKDILSLPSLSPGLNDLPDTSPAAHPA